MLIEGGMCIGRWFYTVYRIQWILLIPIAFLLWKLKTNYRDTSQRPHGLHCHLSTRHRPEAAETIEAECSRVLDDKTLFYRYLVPVKQQRKNDCVLIEIEGTWRRSDGSTARAGSAAGQPQSAES